MPASVETVMADAREMDAITIVPTSLKEKITHIQALFCV